jgi:hypothetical protein
MELKFLGINNARTEDGGFTDLTCDRCGCKASAYLRINFITMSYVLCKGCLLEGVDVIDNTILQDSIEKGRLK